ncbi:protein translocase subunit SecF [Heliobacterium gestii]|uniref:Protein-export membrane protein SecF n=1 Tax=Heliomicrobium gestii TaxID=2699 RepID=A0A845LC53_HELGE|nr:protein translocase subunit SecF [Heliomicrobium gestii]MBM7868072.1 preprotein translocase subunit SecF [Heliomicrobium gestii]MZP44397.1 protein translocase subunit SecF [Heliomicrobium gestii]
MNMIGRRKIWYALSLLILIPGLISLMLRGLNLGIDFTGGSKLELHFEHAVTVEQVRTVLDNANIGKTEVQLAEGNNVIVRTHPLDQSQRNQLLESMKGQVGELSIRSDQTIGPTIGQELARNALLALLLAAIGMVAYISYRFEFKFAVAAIVALFHDILVVAGLFSIFYIEVDSTFVAAILTVFGYSINDTIVIFDRIRENLRKKKKDEPMDALVNRSVTETMTRSIITVLMVIFVLVALLFWGGASTRVFNLAMLIGVISGAYSSIFNASPIWYDLKQIEKAQRRAKMKAA